MIFRSLIQYILFDSFKYAKDYVTNKKNFKVVNEFLLGKGVKTYKAGKGMFTGLTGLFKKGGFVLAMEMNLPVVPIALCGTFESFGKNKMTLNKNNLELRIGKPFQTSSLSYEDRNGFVNSVRNEVIQLKSKTR